MAKYVCAVAFLRLGPGRTAGRGQPIPEVETWAPNIIHANLRMGYIRLATPEEQKRHEGQTGSVGVSTRIEQKAAVTQAPAAQAPVPAADESAEDEDAQETQAAVQKERNDSDGLRASPPRNAAAKKGAGKKGR